MSRVITLLTDFGAQDSYAAAMKGVILGIAPAATLVDITHAIPPQDVFSAAFTLGTCFRYFPAGTIHTIVVDPGVGTRRQALLLVTPDALFVAPDNGVLSYVLEAYSAQEPVSGSPRSLFLPPQAVQIAVPPGLDAHALTNNELFINPVSQTFHGRDVFAPVAAHLCNGLPYDQVGPRTDTVTSFALPRPRRADDGTLLGTVIHIDSFGNLITNLRDADLPTYNPTILIGNYHIQGISASYEGGGNLLAIIGSSGNLEVAAKNGSATTLMGAGRWTEVRVKPG